MTAPAESDKPKGGDTHSPAKKSPPWGWLWFFAAAVIMFIFLAGMYATSERDVQKFYGFLLQLFVVGIILGAAGVGIKIAMDKKH